MRRLDIKNLKEEICHSQGVVIVGIGYYGKYLLDNLYNKYLANIVAIFDNNDLLAGKVYKNITIEKPRNIGNYLYVITVMDICQRDELQKQLISLGISEENIISYMGIKDYEYYSSLDESLYKEEISLQYRNRLGKDMNWDNPLTYNEILNWEKIHVRDERRTEMADKYMARKKVAALIGEKYLTKWYGVWDNVNDINLDELPKAFVLKTNNGSGRNIIVRDKDNLDFNKVREQLAIWLTQNYYFSGPYEWQYRNIVPRVICEEYLEEVTGNACDYDIYCFRGEPVYIQCIRGAHTPDWCGAFYDVKWERQQFSHGCPLDEKLAPKPQHLDEMLSISRILSKEFRHVRVDLYDLPRRGVLFCEMTFTSWAGYSKFTPSKYDEVFGQLIRAKGIQ